MKDAAAKGVMHACIKNRYYDYAGLPMLFTTLLKSGVKIYEYHSSMMHAKFTIIDDWFLCKQPQSPQLLHDLEVDSSKALKQPCSNSSSKLVIGDQVLSPSQQRSLFKRLIGRLMLKLKWPIAIPYK